mgnify:CR=1 FL=1
MADPQLSADDALSAWLEHLAHERRLAPNTLEAYGRIGRLYLAFLARHRGGPQRLADLVAAADAIAGIVRHTGRTAPDVVT